MELAIRHVAFFDPDGAFCRCLGSPYVLLVPLPLEVTPLSLRRSCCLVSPALSIGPRYARCDYNVSNDRCFVMRTPQAPYPRMETSRLLSPPIPSQSVFRCLSIARFSIDGGRLGHIVPLDRGVEA